MMRDRGQLLAPALFLTFVFYIVADNLLGYATPGFPYIYAWCAAFVLGCLTCGFVLRRVPDRWVHVASASLLWCSASSTLVTLSVTPVPGPVLLLTIQIASAGVLLHTGWVIASLVAIVAAAIPLVTHIPGMPPTMAIAALVTAGGFALLIHRLLLAAAMKTEELRIAEAATAKSLAKQLEERASLHDQLLHAQRMEAVGTLAAGVAHDMNNVLASISNVATLLVDGATREQRPDLNQIIEQSDRGAQLTRGLLAFSRRGQYRKEVLGFGSHLERVLPLLRRMLPKSVEVRDEIVVGDARIEADSVHLGQVLMNLALNAADAMHGTGTIAIRASLVQREGRQHIGLQVTDTGHGMDAATRLRVFEPFFTTKPIGQGSGLGLSIVWGIVQAHGGTIDVRSEVGVGSTFTVYLPTTDAPLTAGVPVPAAQPTIRRNTVLVVDDDALVRESTGRLLMRMGLDVLTASNGHEALAVFDDHGERIRIVILDMGMPSMGGAECFRQLRERSNVPVLVATGYAADDNMRELFAAGARIIEKPYAASVLRGEVTQLLEASQPVRLAN
jgi:signal transduction histidine kinase